MLYMHRMGQGSLVNKLGWQEGAHRILTKQEDSQRECKWDVVKHMLLFPEKKHLSSCQLDLNTCVDLSTT